jgi:lantibiotic biosynthesis protein
MTTRYHHRGLVLIRSTTAPADLHVPHDLNLADPGVVTGPGRAWLASTCARDDVREALALASPGLAERIGQLLPATTSPASVKDLRKAILSARAYLVRWQRRVTPFGLFAGVTTATTGAPHAHIGTAHQAVARPDADWITTLAATLERDPELRPHLTVIADNTATVRDGRLLLSRRAEPGSRAPGPLREASVRWTRPVQAATEIAATPIKLADLAAQLATRFPHAAPGKFSALLNGLVDEGFLITSLRPPMTAADPLAHLISALRETARHTVAPLLGDLEDVARQLRAHNTCPGSAQASRHRAAIAARMTTLSAAPRHPLAVDVRLDGQVTIPRLVLEEAIAAADVLLRLGTRPFGSPAWMDYHARFLRRYGPGALVPVTELVADSGLGYPDGYPGAPRQRPAWRALTDRDAALLALIQRATLTGEEEIRLTEADIQALMTGDHADVVPPQRIEIGVTVHAPSVTAIGTGDFELRVTAAPRSPTSMAGRFTHLLTGHERATLAAGYQAGNAMPVQVSFPPRVPHNDNVTRTAPLTSPILPLGEHPPHDTLAISVDDLAVTANAAQLHLIQRSTGRRVSPRIAHALDLTTQTPPLARFIAEVADARTAVFGPFDLGAARALPYVPRIRYRRTTLSPARWRVNSKELSSLLNETGNCAVLLRQWMRRWQVPARIVLCDGELRLPLNLDHPLDRALLRTRLPKPGQAELQDDSPGDGDGWIGRPAELLIPLTLTAPAARPVPVTAPPGTVHRPGASAIVCAQLTGDPARFDDILAAHLPALAERISDRWWVRRHRDLIHPESPQHIAVYLRLPDAGDFAKAAAELAAFAAGLQARGLPGDLTLTSFYEQPGRYGHGAALEAAERVLAADTRAAITQIILAASSGVPGQAIAAASMAQLAAAFGPDPAAGYRALTACLPHRTGPVDRALLRQASRLADPADHFAALRELPGGGAAAAAWATRDLALAAYRQALASQRDPGTVLRTLLHEHHMRALGLDPQFEQLTGRLARAAARQRLALGGRP